VNGDPAPSSALPAPAFSEAPAWAAAGEGWQRLHGSFRELGCSFEWHDFTLARAFDWSRTFHADSVEICLNLEGEGEVRSRASVLKLGPLTSGFYIQGAGPLAASRAAGQRHQFLTIELSRPFLQTHFSASAAGLHGALRNFLARRVMRSAVSAPARLDSTQSALLASLRQPPVAPAALALWYQAKAFEVAAALFFPQAAEAGFFCDKIKRVNQERVEKVLAILRENLAETPPLEEIGRRVGCSPFHLSRIFNQEMGRSMANYLRELRMERAAELLRAGEMKIIQVALEVGYSSPSHFSTAFHEVFGICPGLYPLRTASQPAGKARRNEPS